MVSDQVMTFAKEYLFPQFKFLNKEWIQYEPRRKDNSFSSFMKCHLPIFSGKEVANEWNQIIAPTIVKKYTNTRCNRTTKFVPHSYMSIMRRNKRLLS